MALNLTSFVEKQINSSHECTVTGNGSSYVQDCARDCCVESCLECTCKRCNDSWTESQVEDYCDETCEECKNEERCEDPWVDTTPEEPCDECKCEECPDEPWVETTPEEPCAECTCEECCDEPWADTTPEESYNENEGSESCDGTGSISCSGEGTKKFKVKSLRAVLKVGEKTGLISFLRRGTATWSSNNPDVATVDESTGVVTAQGEGTAIITATCGNCIGTYTIAVDSRKLVRVEKDGDYFIATFEGSATGQGDKWKSVGCDMDNNENRSGYPIYETDDQYLLTHEVNHKHNVVQPFTPEQLAVLYRLDPYGVVYYVKERSRMTLNTLGEQLLYKDDVYRAIFETNPNRFYFTVNSDGVIKYGKYNDWDRTKVYSLAELIFGSHVIFDWVGFWKPIVLTMVGFFPVVSKILTTIQLCHALFFVGSIKGAVSSVASEYLDYYYKQNPDNIYKLKTWPMAILTMINDSLTEGFDRLSVNIDIYESLNDLDYRVVMVDGAFQMGIEQIIALCEDN